MRVVYLIPNDRDYRKDYADALARAADSVQLWYLLQTPGITFTLDKKSVTIVHTDHPAAWYANTPNGDWYEYWFWFNVTTEGRGSSTSMPTLDAVKCGSSNACCLNVQTEASINRIAHNNGRRMSSRSVEGYLMQAWGINDSGQITGCGYNGNWMHAFVLTPTAPAPTSSLNVNVQIYRAAQNRKFISPSGTDEELHCAPNGYSVEQSEIERATKKSGRESPLLVR